MAQVPAQTLSILIVEDDRESGEMLQELLELQGFETRLAQDQVGALRQARVFRPSHILIDIHLNSDADGLEICRRLQATEVEPFTVIAMTGDLTVDADRTRQAGFDAVVYKPLDVERLVRLISRVNVGKDRVAGGKIGSKAACGRM